MTDIRGEIPRGRTSELGVYFNDTRHLNTWETLVNGHAPVPLAQEQRHQGTTWVLSMTNRDLPLIGGAGRIPRDTLLIRRILTLHEDTLFEILTIRNFSGISQILQLEHWAGSRFEDVFEIRGMTRPGRGALLPAQELSPLHWMLSYRGLDGAVRSTHLHRLYSAEKIRVSPYLTGWITRVEIQPKEILTFRTVASFNQPSSLLFNGENFEDLDAGGMMTLAANRGAKPALLDFRIESDNALFNRSVDAAICDVSMLLSRESDSVLYPYAGIPWFSAPFGRDGLITAYQLLPWAPKVARGVLEFVFSGQGTRFDTFTEEEPGKIFHELRRGEMAALREIPFVPYYGSVDATPLALILLHEYACWTSDRESVEKWWPAVEAALEWMDRFGDIDGDLFLEYIRRSERGLSNQGWKDSHDSVVHDDGSLAEAPIRLCEVQAYAYRARLGAAELATWIGKKDLAEKLRMQALRLRAEFQEAFWNPVGQFVYLALDGARRPCSVLSSNMGHCLWGGILTDAQARSVSRHLISESMFSGHGIRTLADTEMAYNPMSYHNGSVWPHDNSLIAQGFHRYGRTTELQAIADALFGVLESSDDFRLPELFCGFRKRGLEPPIPYEVACKPQAWSAGALFLVLRSILGMEKKLNQRAVSLKNPLLLGKVNQLHVSGIEIDGKLASMSFHRAPHGVTATNLSPPGGPPLLVVRTKGD